MDFFNTSSKAAAVKFQTPGQSFDGYITGPVTARQARDFQTKQPKFYPLRPGQTQADPIMEGVVPVKDANTGVEGTIYVNSKLMRQAIEAALREAGVQQPEVGGRLLLTYTGSKQVNGFNAKDYTARYQSPAPGTAPAAPAAPAPAPAAAPVDPGFQHAAAANAVAQAGYAQGGYAQPGYAAAPPAAPGYETQTAAPAGYYPPAY